MTFTSESPNTLSDKRQANPTGTSEHSNRGEEKERLLNCDKTNDDPL